MTTIRKLLAIAHTGFLSFLCLLFLAYAVYRSHSWMLVDFLVFLALVYALASYLQWRDLSKGDKGDQS